MIELRQLRYFIAVAEELHFTRAAQRLCIGQPPLSYAIAQLEAEVGALLFARTKRSVQLTEAGKLLLADARKILALTGAAALSVKAAASGHAGELRIGFTSSTPLTPLFSALINIYRRQFPAVTLTLLEMSTQHQLAALQQQTLDLAFVRPQFGAEQGAVEHAAADALQYLTLRTDPLVVVLPEQHPLATKPQLCVADLATQGFIMYPPQAGTSIYRQLHALCLQAGFTPETVQQAAEASTIIGLVAAGVGISVLPACFDRIQLAGVCYRQLADEMAVTRLLLAYQASEREPQKQLLINQFVALTQTQL
ncbi:MAG: LysR substrate-binding domain-containing protein [Rheinheimera sp.]|nr:LysR substrate-binding domain-containing protein [Rheinheimera sp.]